MWDGVSMAGGVAATTSHAKVDPWVLSALHRSPRIIAKTAETLYEISGGRFVIGLGAGHVCSGQAHAFGLPEESVFALFEEALQGIVSLIRRGRADFEGESTPPAASSSTRWDRVRPRPASDRRQRAEGPAARCAPCGHLERLRGGSVPTSTSSDRVWTLDAICEDIGRDPAFNQPRGGDPGEPVQPAGWKPSVVSGPPEAVADALRLFRDAGHTQVDLMLGLGTVEAFEAMAPVLELIRAD